MYSLGQTRKPENSLLAKGMTTSNLHSKTLCNSLYKSEEYSKACSTVVCYFLGACSLWNPVRLVLFYAFRSRLRGTILISSAVNTD
jgi:hypothetical protein